MVFKNFPLEAHQWARLAAVAAFAAEKQGRFWPYHDTLFENSNRINEQVIFQIAMALKLNIEEFEGDLKNPELVARVNQDAEDGENAGVSSTPTVFINGVLFRGRRVEDFVKKIDEELLKIRKKTDKL